MAILRFHAVFDGQALRPEEPVDLTPHTRYLLTVEQEVTEVGTHDCAGYPLTEILKLATDMGVTDLSSRHSWYAHGRLPDT
jgi:hypothetical protein